MGKSVERMLGAHIVGKCRDRNRWNNISDCSEWHFQHRDSFRIDKSKLLSYWNDGYSQSMSRSKQKLKKKFRFIGNGIVFAYRHSICISKIEKKNLGYPLCRVPHVSLTPMFYEHDQRHVIRYTKIIPQLFCFCVLCIYIFFVVARVLLLLLSFSRSHTRIVCTHTHSVSYSPW